MPRASETPAIHAVGIEKHFAVGAWLPGRTRPSIAALRGLQLTVADDTIHGVIGPNGSGKSTLLRILATLIIADAGTAHVGGYEVQRDEMQVRRLIGFSTGDERSVYWRLTARQNLEFAAALHRLDSPAAAIEEALAQVRLEDNADRPVSGFSQGMARRLGLARALLHKPTVLLLDEPTRSLDPVSRAEFQAVITQLRDESRVTTLLTTHDLGEAKAVCDRVSVMREGLVVDEFADITARRLARAVGAQGLG